MDLTDLPGGARIERGLVEARSGTFGIDGLLVAIGAPRLARAGLDVPESACRVEDAELKLYSLLAKDGGADPYARYNALVRELISFEQAIEHRVRRQRSERQ